MTEKRWRISPERKEEWKEGVKNILIKTAKVAIAVFLIGIVAQLWANNYAAEKILIALLIAPSDDAREDIMIAASNDNPLVALIAVKARFRAITTEEEPLHHKERWAAIAQLAENRLYKDMAWQEHHKREQQARIRQEQAAHPNWFYDMGHAGNLIMQQAQQQQQMSQRGQR